MSEQRAMDVRPYRPDDRAELYGIAVLTGAAGDDATGIYDDPDLLGHVFVGPYVEHQPELAFVAADDDGVAGYVLGALDAEALDGVLEREWWPPLRGRYPLPGSEADRWLVEWIHHPRLAPGAVRSAHPSEFHIDLLPRCQGRGAGRALIERVLTSLRDAGSPGVHCGVDPLNERATGFYAHLGFERVDVAGGVFFVQSL